jgi:hypothetical protein
MKTYCKDVARIPDWAYAPLINGDWFGISKHDKYDMNTFMQPYRDMAKKLNHRNIIVCSVEEQPDSYFSWKPSFGLPCCVYDTYIQVVYEPLVKCEQALVESYSRPDVRVTLDELDVIAECDTITRIGEKFVLAHKVIGAEYTTLLNNSHGICFEVVR